MTAAADDLATRLRTFADSPAPQVAGRKLHAPSHVSRLYKLRQGEPAWIGAQGEVSAAAKLLLEAIRDSWREGLRPSEYHVEALAGYSAGDADAALHAEILFTDAFLALSSHLSAGRIDPAALQIDWAIKRPRADFVTLLHEALKSGTVAETLQSLSPAGARYRQLKESLALYSRIEDRGGFVPVPDGPPLRRGASDERIVALRARLAAEGYLTASESPELDAQVEKALKAFQRSRGLVADGKLNAETVAALNVPVILIIRRIEANLERLRWLPRDLGRRHLFVDIAGYKLMGFEDEKPAISMRIIVGGEYRRTPMLSTQVTSIVLNPYWNIPRSIIEEEILPRLRINPGFLAQRDIRIYEDVGGARRQVDPMSVDWSAVRAGNLRYHFQAHSGSRNPLGSIKFVMPNQFAVYLHGTPDTSLFSRSRRTLSHGCIRVERPLELAEFVLKGTKPRWTRRKLRREIADGVEVRLPLDSAVPVHVWYRTAWLEKDGRLQLRPDVYGWDELVANALAGKAPLVTKAMQSAIRGRRPQARSR